MLINNPMKSLEALKEFNQFTKYYAKLFEDINPDDGVGLMTLFYTSVAAEDCIEANDGDMLLFEWGTDNSGENKTFKYSITRQLIPDGLEEIHEYIWQLRLVFKFVASTETDALGSGHRWCERKEDVPSFVKWITEAEATKSIATKQFGRPELFFENAE